MLKIKDILRAGAFAAAIAFGALGTPAAAQQLQDIGQAGDWDILFAEVDNGPRYCGAARLYQNPAWLHLDRLSTQQPIVLTFYAEGTPKLQTEAPADVTIVFRSSSGDETVSARGSGSNTSRFAGVSVIATPEIIELFKRSSSVGFQYNGYTSDFLPLDNSSAALDQVQSCIDTRF